MADELDTPGDDISGTAAEDTAAAAPAEDTISHEGRYTVLPDVGDGRASSRGTRLTALATVGSLVLVGGVVAVAWRAFSPQQHPAEQLVPSSAFAVAVADLSLPHGQGDSLKAFADVFPDSPTHHGAGSGVDRLLRAAFKQTSDPHVDYDRDIKPWLGDHVALAGWMDGNGKPEAEGLLQVRDEGAARRTLSKTFDGKDGDGTFIFADGYAVIADTQALAHEAVNAAHKSAMSDNNTYKQDLAQLPGSPAITGWADGSGVMKAISAAVPGADQMFNSMGAMGFSPFGSLKQLARGRLAAGVVVNDRYVELDALSIGGSQVEKTADSSSFTGLPASTIVALQLGNPGAIIKQASPLFGILGASTRMAVSSGSGGCFAAVPPSVSALQQNGHMTRRQAIRLRREFLRSRTKCGSTSSTVTVNEPNPLEQIRHYTGLKLPADAITLLGDNMVASYGGIGFDGMPKIALRTHPTDVAAAATVARRLRDTLGRTAHFPLVVDTTSSDLVLSTTSDYAHAVESGGGGLADQAQAKLALGDVPSRVSMAGYVDLSRIFPLVGSVPPDVTHLKAVGFWADSSGAVQHTQFRLVVG